MAKVCLFLIIYLISVASHAKGVFGYWSGITDYIDFTNTHYEVEVNVEIKKCGGIGICIYDYSNWCYLPQILIRDGTDLVLDGKVVGQITDDGFTVSYSTENMNYEFEMILLNSEEATIKDKATFTNGTFESVNGRVYLQYN